MVYVIVVLVVAVIFMGWVHARKLKNDRLRNNGGCSGGCAGCAGRSQCEKDKHKGDNYTKNKIILFNSDKQDKISLFALKWYLHIFNSKSNI